MTDKLVKDGKVAVAYSPGYGAGWTTWNRDVSPFDPKIVQWVLDGKAGNPPLDHLPDNVYDGGCEQLEIEWLPEGTQFVIDEYDGYESIQVKHGMPWHTC